MNKVTIEIDGQSLTAEAGQMVIQVADDAGIYIPRFCYHKKLSIAANCRMCLVDIEKVGKPLPACATPIQEGMVVRTKSTKARDAQKGMMEFLLINHPLDCPICDQGGQCELQDLAVGYGRSLSRYDEGKRAVNDQSLGSLIATEMTRCIHCTRCIRFGEEIAGMPELGMTGRGEDCRVTTYIEQSLHSEISANVIDLCPVGALTSKPFRYTARAWELEQASTIAAHDCVGSHMSVHRRHGHVMRVVPRHHEPINETWISDRDRYSYCGLNHSDRIQQPMLKEEGKWRDVDWQTALEFIVSRVQDTVKAFGPTEIGALVSPNATVEEMYLLQRLMRDLGSHNIDHRLRRQDFSLQEHEALYPGSQLSIADFSKQQAVFLIGSHLRHEQPIINHRVRQAALSGAQIVVLHAIDYELNYPVLSKMITAPSDFPRILMGIAKALLSVQSDTTFSEARDLLTAVNPTEQQQTIAQQLANSERSVVILGALAQEHPRASLIASLAELITKLSGAKLAVLTPGPNTAGAWLAGAVPHRGAAGAPVAQAGLHAGQQLCQSLRAYFLLNVDPELDCCDARKAMHTLQQADLVVAMTPFMGSATSYANVILPITTSFETAGTFINVAGEWQSFQAVIPPMASARPAWKILRVLGELLGLSGFEYHTASEVCDHLRRELQKTASLAFHTWQAPAMSCQTSPDIEYIITLPIYRVDSLVRRSAPLQTSAIAVQCAVYMPSELANRLSLEHEISVKLIQEDVEVMLPLILDERIAANCVFIPAGFPEVACLNHSQAFSMQRGSQV